MQTQYLTDERTSPQIPQDGKQPLRVVIAYDDAAAGKRAMRTMGNLTKGLADEIKLQPLPWRFDLLADTDWFRVAASDAVNADILIIATSSAKPLPDAVGRWVEDAISQKRGTSAAVVALFGPEENPDELGSSRLHGIQTAAERAGLDFFAPGPRHELDGDIARIHQRAEMVTPLLDEILHHQQPAPFRNANF